MDIIEAIRDPNILGDTISPAQEAALRSLYGLPVEGALVELAEQCTGHSWTPGTEYREAALICGRRSGKSDKLAANVAIYEAFFRNHSLSPGETGVVLLMAQNMRQANIVKGYIEGKIHALAGDPEAARDAFQRSLNADSKFIPTLKAQLELDGESDSTLAMLVLATAEIEKLELEEKLPQ